MKTTKRILAILLTTLLTLGAFAVGAGALFENGRAFPSFAPIPSAILQALTEQEEDEIRELRAAIRFRQEMEFYKTLAASTGFYAKDLFTGSVQREWDDELGEYVVVGVSNAVLVAFKAGKTPMAYWAAYDAAVEPLQNACEAAFIALVAKYGYDREDSGFDYWEFYEDLYRNDKLEAYFEEYYALEYGSEILTVYDALATEYFKPEALAALDRFGELMLVQIAFEEAYVNGDLSDEDASELGHALQELFLNAGPELFVLLGVGGWAGTQAMLAELIGAAEDLLADFGVIPRPVRYTLTYSANNGTGGPAARTGIARGVVVTLATTGLPIRAGYTFKGWSATAAGTTAITSVTVNANTTVYAIWEALCAVTVNGGTTNKTIAAAGEIVTIAANEPTSGFFKAQKFRNWTAVGVTLGSPTSASTSFTMPGNAVTLTAQYDSMIRLWGKTTDYQSSFLNWIMCIVCFGWIWMYF